MSGKSYVQRKKVTFKSDPNMHLEYCHNLIAQTKPNTSQSKEYNPSDAMIMARLINDLNTKVIKKGASFSQQYLLNKGINVFGHKGQTASMKEMDQLHRRSCFTPISIAKMTSIEQRKAQQASMFQEKRKTEPSKEEWFIMESQQENGYREKTQQVQQQHSRA